MTQRGVLSPLTVSREAASIVGDLIEVRMLHPDWQARIHRIRDDARSSAALRPVHSLTHLPTFGNKLRAAAHRRRRDNGSAAITLHSLPRDEATAGFHFLALLSHPDAPALKDHESSAVRDIAVELARSLQAKPGARPLSREEAEKRIADYNEFRDPGLRTHAKNLEARLARLAKLGRTLLAAIPAALRKL
jgi:hypothetical protein